MFSLIITIISIALVAVLALATLYYGGDAFNKGSAEAQAAKLLNQGQQLLGAAELYYAENRDWPASINDLIAGNYLKSTPVALAGGQALSEAQAAAAWEMPVPNVPVFRVNIESEAACAQFNKKAYAGTAQTPATVDPALTAQCYGDAQALTVVVQKRAGQLQAMLDASAAWLNTYPTIFSGGGFYPLFRAPEGSAPATVTFSFDTPIPGLTIFAANLADASGTAITPCGSGDGTTWTCTTTEATPNVTLGVSWNGDGGSGQHTDVRATSGGVSVTFHLLTVDI